MSASDPSIPKSFALIRCSADAWANKRMVVKIMPGLVSATGHEVHFFNAGAASASDLLVAPPASVLLDFERMPMIRASCQLWIPIE
jgi:ethanolamine utilization microcompartment shell protein EutL